MKKFLPLMITWVVGGFALAEFYLPWYRVNDIMEVFLGWGLVLAAFAFVLGGINVLQVNWPLIRRREADWQYKVLLLASAAFMGLIGVKWHDFGGKPANGAMSISRPAAQASSSQAVIRVTTTRDDAVVTVDGQPARTPNTAPAEFTVAPGKHSLLVSVPIAGYGEFSKELDLQAGQVAEVKTDLVTLWGPSGRVYTWMYKYVFDPCNATMFALLAFFIASAAFRAFRARNVEAALLLGAAIIIMIGRAPIGAYMSSFFPEVSDWILDVPNNAGRRAIMMGAALGAIATGLRVILGLERSHLGSGD